MHVLMRHVVPRCLGATTRGEGVFVQIVSYYQRTSSSSYYSETRRISKVGTTWGRERGRVILTVILVLCLHINTSYAPLSLIMWERKLCVHTVPHVALCPPVVQSCF